jgi:hypothetical protein
MSSSGHGGPRAGAGRKPNPDRKVKRSVTLSPTTDTIVLTAMRPEESYSQTLDRLLCTVSGVWEAQTVVPESVRGLLGTLSSEREPVALVYRRLGWSRQVFEQVIQQYRELLAARGMRLYVATKDAASGRQERYITVDGMRYSAISCEHALMQP